MTVRTQLDTFVLGTAARRPMLSVCPVSGCRRLTMGGTCVEHDAPVTVTFPRGRPFVRSAVGFAPERLVSPV